MHGIGTAPLIGFNWSYVMILITLFLLFLVLRKYFWKKIKAFLDERSKEIQEKYDSADEMIENTKKVQEDYDKKLVDIKKRQTEMFKETKAIADERAQNIIAEAQKKAEQIIEKARQDADYEKEKALVSVKEQVAVLTYLAVEKILKQNLTEKQKQEYLANIIINE
jgi:F-type H+-transporting ATPase subunit b